MRKTGLLAAAVLAAALLGGCNAPQGRMHDVTNTQVAHTA